MPGIVRFFLGLLLIPACWGASRAVVDALASAAGSGDAFGAEPIAFCGGIVAFAVAWVVLPRPVRFYVLGHELTHALWGLLFGAVPSRLRVSAKGGSVNLTKTNLFITLAPYFFPFYTFVVILAACAVSFFVHPLPWRPAWTFAIGLTWAFHLLFTLQTLTQSQPDVHVYGRVFSWTFIFLANAAIVLTGLVAATELTSGEAWGFLRGRTVSAYAAVGSATFSAADRVKGLFAR